MCGPRTATNDAEGVTQDFAGGIDSQFTAGGNDRFGQNLELPQRSQGDAEINFFTNEKFFIETTDGVEILPCRKEKRAGAKV